MKVGLDTNVFGYAAGIGDDDAKRRRAAWLLAELNPGQVVLTTQVAGEFYNILVRKGGQNPKIARKIVQDWGDVLGLIAHTPDLMRSALEGAAFRNLQVWDALILEVCAEAGCELFLSEDFQDGFVYRDMTVANPFATQPNERLAVLLGMLTQPPAERKPEGS